MTAPVRQADTGVAHCFAAPMTGSGRIRSDGEPTTDAAVAPTTSDRSRPAAVLKHLLETTSGPEAIRSLACAAFTAARQAVDTICRYGAFAIRFVSDSMLFVSNVRSSS